MFHKCFTVYSLRQVQVALVLQVQVEFVCATNKINSNHWIIGLHDNIGGGKPLDFLVSDLKD